MKQKRKITLDDYIIAHRRARRQAEIDLHGKSIWFKYSICSSKKKYKRKKFRLGDLEK